MCAAIGWGCRQPVRAWRDDPPHHQPPDVNYIEVLANVDFPYRVHF
jgi:hypothetical protein